jgi:RNase H-like domain found in reverse transcriptase
MDFAIIAAPLFKITRKDSGYKKDTATGAADCSGGLGAILMQVDINGNHYAISFASRQLKDHEKNFLFC